MKILQFITLYLYVCVLNTAENKGKFGWKCKFNCACMRGSCDQATGNCVSGCQDGKYGHGCQLDSDCMYDRQGRNYTGNVNATGGEQACISWSDPFVQSRGYNLTQFPDGDDPKNYCRNPRGRLGYYAVKPWCFFSTTEDRPFEYCNIKHCDCPDGLFGPGCVSYCHCRDMEEPCHKVTGSCTSGCAASWTGLDCQIGCSPGWYGSGCQKKCGQCYKNQCDPETGHCKLGCRPGYRGRQCGAKCQNGSYGRDCVGRCGHCRDGEFCHPKIGVCFRGCADGYTGERCLHRCHFGRFGLRCLQDCAYCREGTTCDHVTGRCLNGCTAGKTGNKCDRECSEGSYGENCSYSCGQCRGHCLATTGQCVGGCKDGHSGHRCTPDPAQNQRSVGDMGGAVTTFSTALLIASFSSIVLCVFKKKRREKTDSNATESTIVSDRLEDPTSPSPLDCTRPEPEGQESDNFGQLRGGRFMDVREKYDTGSLLSDTVLPGSSFQPSFYFKGSQDLPRVFSSIEDIFGCTDENTSAAYGHEYHDT